MSTSPLSSSNMQFLIQQSTSAAQVAQPARPKPSANQESFAAALNGVSAASATLSDVTLSSLTNGMSSTAAVDTASTSVSSLLNILV